MARYTPTENEDYMSQKQINYFRKRLLDWREELLIGSQDLFVSLKETDLKRPDLVDLGSIQAEKERLLNTRNKQSQMIAKIEHALERINNGTYGYCEVTGEEIGLNRLMVMPLATHCIEAQEQIERCRRLYH